MISFLSLSLKTLVLLCVTHQMDAYTGMTRSYFSMSRGKTRQSPVDLSSPSTELTLQKRGFRYVIGSDESGRGCLAGPVIAASCCIIQDLSTYTPIIGLDDSKVLKESERRRIYDYVLDNPDTYVFRTATRSSEVVDERNILLATMDTFKESIEELVNENNLPTNATYSIVDGKKTPKLTGENTIPCRPWVKGDSSVYTVALASVIAKVQRDVLMAEAHALYPQYGFDTHKGYGTPEHIAAIHKYGSCPIHRMSFKQIQGR